MYIQQESLRIVLVTDDGRKSETFSVARPLVVCRRFFLVYP